MSLLSFHKRVRTAKKLCRSCRAIAKSKWLPYIMFVLGFTIAVNALVIYHLRKSMRQSMRLKRSYVYLSTVNLPQPQVNRKRDLDLDVILSKKHLNMFSAITSSGYKIRFRSIIGADKVQRKIDRTLKPGEPVLYKTGILTNKTLKGYIGSGMLLPGSEDEAVARRLMSVRREKIINPHDYNYRINPFHSCTNQTSDVVLAVVTAVQNFQNRRKFRYSIKGGYAGIWNQANKVILLFFIGVPSSDNIIHLQDRIDRESKQFGDIVQGTYIDSYRNLSLKTVSILKWVSSYCQSSKFMIKTDDDCDVNIPLMLTEFNKMRAQRPVFMLGKVSRKLTPLRNKKSKWFIPYSVYSKDKYPVFLYGGSQGYPISVANLLYEAAIRIPTFWLEDVYISGLCASMVNVPRYDSAAFYFTHFPPVNETEY